MQTDRLDKKVIGIGLACLDQLIMWEDVRAPVAGNRILAFDVQGGGMTGTALVAVTRLGGRAEFWGAAGTDSMGDMVVRGLAEEKVDTSQVKRVEGGRGPMVVVCVDRPTGERYFLHSVGLDLRDLDVGSLERLRSAGCLLVDCMIHGSAVRAAREARRLGVPVVADVGGGLSGPVRELLAHVDYAIAGQGCARALGVGDDCGRACEALRAAGPGHVVVTLGDRGLVALAGDRLIRMDAFAVNVVDTCGAGDVFHGAFCCGLIKGLSFDQNLSFSAAAAALKCRRLGGRAGIPTFGEVVEFLRARGLSLPA
jgi:sulfofructose kinase